MKLLEAKFKKVRKGKLPKTNLKKNTLKFGVIGIKAMESGLLNTYQMDSMLILLKKKLKKTAKIWIRIYPHVSITSKPLEVRMGKGKGSIKYLSAKISCGSILIELTHKKISKSTIISILKSIKYKFPVKTKLTHI